MLKSNLVKLDMEVQIMIRIINKDKTKGIPQLPRSLDSLATTVENVCFH